MHSCMNGSNCHTYDTHKVHTDKCELLDYAVIRKWRTATRQHLQERLQQRRNSVDIPWVRANSQRMNLYSTRAVLDTRYPRPLHCFLCPIHKVWYVELALLSTTIASLFEWCTHPLYGFAVSYPHKQTCCEHSPPCCSTVWKSCMFFYAYQWWCSCSHTLNTGISVPWRTNSSTTTWATMMLCGAHNLQMRWRGG